MVIVKTPLRISFVGGGSDIKDFYLKQDGTGSRTITWGGDFRFSGGTAPTLTTTGGKTDYLGFIYNSNDSKWDCIAQSLNH